MRSGGRVKSTGEIELGPTLLGIPRIQTSNSESVPMDVDRNRANGRVSWIRNRRTSRERDIASFVKNAAIGVKSVPNKRQRVRSQSHRTWDGGSDSAPWRQKKGRALDGGHLKGCLLYPITNLSMCKISAYIEYLIKKARYSM